MQRKFSKISRAPSDVVKAAANERWKQLKTQYPLTPGEACRRNFKLIETE